VEWIKELGMQLDIESIHKEYQSGESMLGLCIDGIPHAIFIFSDTIRETSKDIIQTLHDDQLQTMILSGDQESTVKSIADKLGMKAVPCRTPSSRKVGEDLRIAKSRTSPRHDRRWHQ